MSAQYFDIANEYISTLKQGRMPGVIYDTAVIGSLHDNLGISIFPNQVKQVLNMQKDDGSWGATYYNPYDRLLSTISVMHMITELELEQNNSQIRDQYSRATSWLEQNFDPNLKYPYPLPVGFEFLFPYYAGQIMDKNSDMSINLSTLEQNRQKKLSVIERVAFDRISPLLFSMEGVVEKADDAEKLAKFQSKNGSLAASPSATSVFIKYNISEAKPNAMNYLRKSIHTNNLAVHFSDYQYMNIAFSLYPLFKADYKFGVQALYVQNLLRKGWTKNGISFGKAFLSPDSDDTAMALVNLQHLGDKSTQERLNILLRYENDNHFKTYFDELHPALMTNIHILEAFLAIDHPRGEEIIDKLLHFVKDNVRDLKGISKYNSSPIIQLSSLVMSLVPKLPEGSDLCLNHLQDEILQGIEDNTMFVEEYAHSLLALLYAKKNGAGVDSALINMTYDRLKSGIQHGTEFSETCTWTSKVQYSPTQISQGHIIASLMLYDKVML